MSTLNAIQVIDWTHNNQLVANNDFTDNSIYVIAVRCPFTQSRELARQHIRQALQSALAQLLSCQPNQIALTSTPGQAIRVIQANHNRSNIGLSISHEIGLSLAAINLIGKVGLDIMAVDKKININEINVLASQYLGAAIATYIASLPPVAQTLAFAISWVNFEARLKCAGEPISEWSATQEKRLANYTSRPLHLNSFNGKTSYVGTICNENNNAC